MHNAKVLIAQAMSTISRNFKRTGDPLGLKTVYWTHWRRGLELTPMGPTLLLTSRMYQMLPYVVHATEIGAAVRPFLQILKFKVFSQIVCMIESLAVDPLLRFYARRSVHVRQRSEEALKGIVSALKRCGLRCAYLDDIEPYSGALLHDLGMETAVGPMARAAYQALKEAGAHTVVTTDPHTTFILREIYPRYVPDFDLDVRHYLQILSDSPSLSVRSHPLGLPDRIVFHDSCVMTRTLGIVQPARVVLNRLGIEILEPENSGINTACCGGPVEYAFADLSRSISWIRVQELASKAKDIVVACPICLINLMKHEKQLGVRVWDMGELLSAFSCSNIKC